MAKNYFGRGERIDIPANVLTNPVSSGDIVALGKTHGIALHDGAANAENVVQLEGIWTLPKDTAAGSGNTVIGVIAYVKDVTGTLKVTADPTGATAMGTFTAIHGDAATVAAVKLHGGAVGVP